MEIYKRLDAFVHDSGNVLTMGTFDGVHHGHRFMLERVKRLAVEREGIASVITFEPHPQKVLKKPGVESIRLLTTFAEKAEHIASCGIERLYVIPFTTEFAQLTSEEYVENILFDKIGFQAVVIGYDHTFGRDRAGGIHTLQKFSNDFHFHVEQVKEYKIDEKVVSSTRIRKLLVDGDVQGAHRLLGYAYTVTGTVVKGDGRGRELGFPTANIEFDGSAKAIPATGIYVVEVMLDSRIYYGMANLGYRPTFDSSPLTLEVNIFNFSRDIYGKTAKLAFLHKLRDEEKFQNIAALVRQIEQDQIDAKQYLQENKLSNGVE